MSFQETKNASSQILSQYTDTFESLSKQRQAFQIHPVPIEGLKALKRTVKEWSKQALEKCEIASSGTDIFALDQFCNITAICETILLSAVTDPNIQFFLCEDAEGNIQAMGSVAPDANDPSLLHLVDLMTHPHNIRADVNQQESHRAQGAGSALREDATPPFPFHRSKGFLLESGVPRAGFSDDQNSDKNSPGCRFSLEERCLIAHGQRQRCGIVVEGLSLAKEFDFLQKLLNELSGLFFLMLQ